VPGWPEGEITTRYSEVGRNKCGKCPKGAWLDERRLVIQERDQNWNETPDTCDRLISLQQWLVREDGNLLCFAQDHHREERRSHGCYPVAVLKPLLVSRFLEMIWSNEPT
jgi:hypothetical protein